MDVTSLLRSIRSHTRWLYPLAVLLAAILFGNIFGLGLALLIVAGGVLFGSIWMFWSSLQGLSGNVPISLDEALSLGAPSAEEEQKRAVLRALKDLEYERAVGKINDEDYTTLAAHYKNEAKRLLRAVDADLTPERERAEQLLRERLKAAGLANGADAEGGVDKPRAGREAVSEDEPLADDVANDDAASDESGAPKRPAPETAS